MKILLLVLLTLTLSVSARAATYKLKWNPNPPEEGVLAYRIYKITEAGRELLGTAPTNRIETEAQPGDRLVVTAWNGSESEPSDELVIPAPPTKPGAPVILELEQSSNMKDWRPLARNYVEPDGPQQFFRLRIVKP
jgi:hypothetical protein